MCKEAFDLLEARFGEKRAWYYLWEETCYPMDGEIALWQTKAILKNAVPRSNEEE